MLSTKRKILVSSISLSLILVFLVHLIFSNCSNSAINTRTLSLKKSSIDNQAILNDFDDATLKTNGTMTSFVGYKDIDGSMFEKIDNLSEDNIDNFENCRVKYDFSYDTESNIVTISAEMKNSVGEISIDHVQGRCFINDEGDIDAVMNIEGEAILLSEMRDAGMIQNCAWFTNLIKKVAVVTTIVAATVAVAAVIVATAGTATPAVVGVGVAAASSASAALTIASTSLVIATISAGVALTADIINKTYPGINATTTTVGNERIATVSYSNQKTKEAIRDITIASIKANPNNPEIYFRVTNYNTNGPTKVSLEPYTKATMANNMKLYSWSSLTTNSNDARSVISLAFPGCSIIRDSVGVHHFHAVNSSKSHMKGLDGKYIVHSFFQQ